MTTFLTLVHLFIEQAHHNRLLAISLDPIGWTTQVGTNFSKNLQSMKGFRTIEPMN